jgi:hypothetical protein
MNPMAAQLLKEIATNIDDIRIELARAREQVETVTKAKDDLQRRTWGQSREVHVLQERLEEFAEMKAENERFQKTRGEIEERLRRILKSTQALSAEFRS